MASEVQIRTSLRIDKGNLHHQSNPTSFTGSIEGEKGPYPGSITIPTTGINIDFTEIGVPGYATIQNLDDTNYVEYGIHDGSVFHPIHEILPGEIYPVRFSRNLGVIEDVPGTGSTGVVNQFFIRANHASCDVVIAAFKR